MDIQDKDGKTALIFTVLNGHTNIAASLIAIDANVVVMRAGVKGHVKCL